LAFATRDVIDPERLVPFQGSTLWLGFLIFSDYARGAIRLSAIMEIPTIHISHTIQSGRRRWADASTDRADRQLAGDTGADRCYGRVTQ